MSCSALITSVPSICARWHRERLAETLAPVGPQGPPARRCARLVAVAPRARGSLLWTTGTSCVSANLSTMSPNTRPPSPQPLQGRRGGISGPCRGHGSRYQSFRFQKSLSQPLKVALSLCDIAATQRRFTTGITATSSTTISFILMNNAARLTGSSSPWAARKILSYSSLRQRVGLMPCHLLSFEAIS